MYHTRAGTEVTNIESIANTPGSRAPDAKANAAPPTPVAATVATAAVTAKRFGADCLRKSDTALALRTTIRVDVNSSTSRPRSALTRCATNFHSWSLPLAVVGNSTVTTSI